MLNDDDILKTRCNEETLDYSLAIELKKKIFPLLDKAHNIWGDNFNKEFVQYLRGRKIRNNNAEILIGIRYKLDKHKSDFTLKERASITLHIEYLPLLEGMFSNSINFLIFILIRNHHDFYYSGNYANNMTSIERATIEEKINFLNTHDFSIIDEKIDRKLRHSTAHMFYEIKEDGITYVEGIAKDVNLAYQELRQVAFVLHLIYEVYYRRFVAN